MKYLWTDNVKQPSFSALDGNKSTEVLVIGGGMAGVLCALELAAKGVDYILAEGKKIGGGITKGTTAVLTAQHDTLYQNMINSLGKENARLYLNANLNAVDKFRQLSRSIPCDFEEKSSVMYSLDNKTLMENEARAVNSLGFKAEFITKTAAPFDVAGAVKYPGMAQFHPLKFLYGAAKSLNIYDNTFVHHLDGTTAVTDRGNIYADKVIIATHFPFINSHGLYFMKLYQKRSYVIALENAPELDCTIEDIGKNGIYMRNYNGLLLIGGGDSRTGKKGKGFSAPREFAGKYYENAIEKYAWANQDCVSLDGIPYIGRYGKLTKNIYTATGFNLWGMTTSMAAADILTDLVVGRSNKFAPAFEPSRSMITAQLAANIGNTLIDFAVPTTKRCSHMGCALKWNPYEHSWDCPCHGSRYEESGKLINNPAMKNIDIKK